MVQKGVYQSVGLHRHQNSRQLASRQFGILADTNNPASRVLGSHFLSILYRFTGARFRSASSLSRSTNPASTDSASA